MSNAFFNFDELYFKGGNKRFQNTQMKSFHKQNTTMQANAEIFKIPIAML